MEDSTKADGNFEHRTTPARRRATKKYDLKFSCLKLRLDPLVKKKAVEAAKRLNMSLNAYVTYLINKDTGA